MGRSLEPLSKAEYEKLPKWQQWIGNYPLMTILILLLAAIVVAILASSFSEIIV